MTILQKAKSRKMLIPKESHIYIGGGGYPLSKPGSHCMRRNRPVDLQSQRQRRTPVLT